jgi:hypothetical protein
MQFEILLQYILILSQYLEIKLSIGIDACPPHVIILTLLLVNIASGLILGTHNGPTLAGVKSITLMSLF